MVRKIHKIIKNLGFNSRYMVCEFTYGTIGGHPINFEMTTDYGEVWNGTFIDWNGGKNFLKNLGLKFQDNDQLDFRIIWKSEDISYDRGGGGDLIYLEPTIKIINDEPTLTYRG
jgi:hypothetical protein